MNHELATIDVLIVLLYILGTTLLGAWFSGRQKNLKTYFVGNRNVSWWLVLASIVATETSTVTFLSVPGVAYNPNGGNLTFLQLSFGYILGRTLIAWLLLPQYMRGELFSAYQLLRERFNSAVQRTASALFLVTRTVADGLRLFLTGLLLQQFTGWSIELSILVMGIATLIYTYLGGMEAVIWTDLIQLLIYIFGALAAAMVLLQLLGGTGPYLDIGHAAGKFQLFDFDFDWTKPYAFWTGLIGGAVFTMASHGADQLMVQRYLCSRSLNQARTALVLSGLVVLLQFLLFLGIGVGLFALSQKGILNVPDGMRNDAVFGLFITRHLPAGLIGVVIAAVLAAAMSTLSSSLNSSANVLVTDFYRPLRPGRSETEYLRISKLMTSVWGVAQIAVALIAWWLNSPRSIVDQVLSVAGFTTGMLLGVFILGTLGSGLCRRPVSALVGLVTGFLTVLGVWAYSLYDRQGALAWPWYAPIGASVTVIVGLITEQGLKGTHGSTTNRSAKPSLDQPG